MRTTLDIDDDLLRTVQELARRQGASAGKIASQLMRTALLAPTGSRDESQATSEAPSRLGFRPLRNGKALVTNDEVNRLRDAEAV